MFSPAPKYLAIIVIAYVKGNYIFNNDKDKVKLILPYIFLVSLISIRFKKAMIYHYQPINQSSKVMYKVKPQNNQYKNGKYLLPRLERNLTVCSKPSLIPAVGVTMAIECTTKCIKFSVKFSPAKNSLKVLCSLPSRISSI